MKPLAAGAQEPAEALIVLDQGGGIASFATGISDDGIVGIVYDENFASSRPVYWSHPAAPAQFLKIDGYESAFIFDVKIGKGGIVGAGGDVALYWRDPDADPIRLPGFGGAAIATGIHDGWIAGYGSTDGFRTVSAYLWTDPSQSPVVLPWGGTGAVALGISNGWVVGEGYSSINGVFRGQALLWTDPANPDAAPIALPDLGTRSSAYGIGEGGVVGPAFDSNWRAQALLWADPANPGASPTLLGDLGGRYTYAQAIGGGGVVGYGIDPAVDHERALAWDLANPAAPIVLADLGGEFNYPLAIARGGIVGGAIDAGGIDRAVFWPNPFVPTNAAPTADAGPDVTLVAGETGAFDGSASGDSDGTVASWSWEFGDGSTAIGANVTHAYAASGGYTLTLTIMDDGGLADSDTAHVSVITPVEAIQLVRALVESFDLRQGIWNALDSKLEAVEDALEAGNAGLRSDAVNKLEAFVSHVEAQRGKAITDAQADTLIGWSWRIRSVL